ncbi:MAG TPA: SigE family RNA polymerase sigma factor [Nocardioidaceae bacterium]|nr:SigE family RNA polymerase sigma factor [Nocardioidaceae bacterium]
MDFETFVHARSAALARTAYLLTGDVHAAEDLLQETLARSAERWSKIIRGGDPEPYVRRVLYTRAVDGFRRRRLVEVHTEHPELAGPGDEADAHASRLVLREALMRLTPRQRAVLVVRFFEDRSEVETAALLGCSVSTVKSQTRHALGRLRELAPDLLADFSPVEAP